MAAYTGAALPHDHLMMVQDIDPALAETAVGAVKQLQAHCLPTIQDWVRIVTKVPHVPSLSRLNCHTLLLPSPTVEMALWLRHWGSLVNCMRQELQGWISAFELQTVNPEYNAFVDCQVENQS